MNLKLIYNRVNNNESIQFFKYSRIKFHSAIKLYNPFSIQKQVKYAINKKVLISQKPLRMTVNLIWYYFQLISKLVDKSDLKAV